MPCSIVDMCCVAYIQRFPPLRSYTGRTRTLARDAYANVCTAPYTRSMCQSVVPVRPSTCTRREREGKNSSSVCSHKCFCLTPRTYSLTVPVLLLVRQSLAIEVGGREGGRGKGGCRRCGDFMGGRTGGLPVDRPAGRPAPRASCPV